MSQSAHPFVLTQFAALKDPRQQAKVLYPLAEILLLALAATIAGADDFVEVTLWGEQNQAFLRRFHPYQRGIPSHDTMCDVFAAIDAELFKACFYAWVKEVRDGLPDLIAIDGKTSRRSHDRGKGRKPLHLVSAWAAGQRIVVGQQACEEKSNEVTAIPLLLRNLALKPNWPATYAEVVLLFENPPAGTLFEMDKTVDGCNGRIATRRHTVVCEVDWMTSDRHYPGEPKFPGLAMIGRVQSEVERDGVITAETRYYLCSVKLSAEMFGWAVRSHWAVENRLHWILDVVFREDLARLRSGNAPANMAIVRHAAVNLLSRAKPTTSFKNRRKRAGWNTDYLEAVIRGTA